MSFIFMLLTISYYFLFYIPKREKQKIDLIYLRDKKISECLSIARDLKYSSWDSNCKGLGYKPDCELPFDHAEFIERSYQNNKNDCYKRFNF